MSPPNPYGSEGNKTGSTFFFSLQANETPGQVFYNGTAPVDGGVGSWRWEGVSWALYGVIAVGVALIM